MDSWKGWLFSKTMQKKFVSAILGITLVIGSNLPSLAEKAVQPAENGWNLNYTRVDKGYKKWKWQHSFEEYRIGRAGPINSQGIVGVPGWPVMAFGHQMYIRYSEFILSLYLEKDGKQTKPYLLPSFHQTLEDGYLPIIVTKFQNDGVDYTVRYMMVPSNPQPVDVMEISISNQGKDLSNTVLLADFDGAPTLKVAGNLIDDRGKPLAVLDGLPENIQYIERNSGVVDPRCTPAGFLPCDDFKTWREGFYGMPIEYMVKVDAGKEYPVFLATDRVPFMPTFALPYETPRSLTLTVEGSPSVRVGPAEFGVQTFSGKDTDGDGYIKVISQANPESRQPAFLCAIYVFEPGVAGIKAEDITSRKPSITPRNTIICGRNAPTWYQDYIDGDDPTWKALQLRYGGGIKPGETRHYTIKLPAIDRVEKIPYGSSYHPYDTAQSWMRSVQPRFPDNQTPYGEDVPPGIDPAQYGTFGPKPRTLWTQQLQAASDITSQKAIKTIKAYWDKYLEQRVRFTLPDKDMEDTYKAQLIFMATYILKWGDYDVYTVMGGPFNYWDTCYRDGSYQIRALDMVGYSDVAAKLCNSILTPKSKLPVSRWEFGQWDDAANLGMWQTRPRQWDGQGQLLGALTDHYLFTGDKEWLNAAYSGISKGTQWIETMRDKQKAIAKDPNSLSYGLMPSGELESGGSGHPFYISAYCIYGMEQAARAADLVGKKADAAKFRKWAADFRKYTVNGARKSIVRFNDYCGTLPAEPGSIDNLGAWPGSSLVYPTQLFQPFDPVMNSWYRFKEEDGFNSGGIMGFPYILTDWAISYIRRGEPDRYVDLFCSYMDTASEMKGWSEVYDLYKNYKHDGVEKTAVFGGGDQPHGEGCSNYIILMRNLFLHEENTALHIAPATPRRWMADGKQFGVTDAPTYFGNVTFTVVPHQESKRISASISIKKGVYPLGKLLVHLRNATGAKLTEVKVNGKPVDTFWGETITIANPPANMEIEASIE